MILGCWEIKQIRPDLGCCDSCHEDLDYGMSMIWEILEVDDKKLEFEVCCKISKAMEEIKDGE